MDARLPIVSAAAMAFRSLSHRCMGDEGAARLIFEVVEYSKRLQSFTKSILAVWAARQYLFHYMRPGKAACPAEAVIVQVAA